MKIHFDSMTSGGTNCEYMNDYVVCWDEARKIYAGVYSWPNCGTDSVILGHRREVRYFCNGTLAVVRQINIVGLGWIDLGNAAVTSTSRVSCNPFYAVSQADISRVGCCGGTPTVDLQPVHVRAA